jgi:threonine dehydratase
MSDPSPSLADFRAAREGLRGRIRETPVWQLTRGAVVDALAPAGEVWVKLELWQHAGSFKARGALLAIDSLDAASRARGVVAVSAGNHALAVGYAARAAAVSAKVVMPKSADPRRVEGCRALGADVVLVDDVHLAFAKARSIAAEEGRTFVHPFESRAVVLGTGSIALELHEQIPSLDAIVIPIGGGGLAAGIAAASAQMRPATACFGVEPTGADSMHASFRAGSPQPIDAVRTIADSLGSPRAEPMTFELCRRHLRELVRVDDDLLRDAMRVLHRELALAVEPACAASTAAALGPLRETLRGKRCALILCGSSLGFDTIARHLTHA